MKKATPRLTPPWPALPLNNLRCRLFSLFLVLLVCCSPVYASGESADEPGWLDALMEKLGSGDEYNPDKIIDFGILPGPFYTPETELGIGIAAIGLYKTNRKDDQERISTLSISGFGSITGAIGLNVENHSFFMRDKLRLFIDASIIHAPECYWGIGYAQNADDDNIEDYTDVTFSVMPRLYARVLENLYVGAGFQFIQNQAEDTEPEGLFYQDNPYGTDVVSSGYSLHIMSDTRDYIPNPYKGYLLNLDFYGYEKSLGSDADFSVTELTLNGYWNVHNNNILAAQGYVRSSQGDVPWCQLSQVGGGKIMRGYWRGRFRDKQMAAAQVEYRHHLVGRHGVTTWIGAALTAPEFEDMNGDEILPNFGIGYRLAFKYRSNVRLDLGFGKHDEIGFYFNVNEAF